MSRHLPPRRARVPVEFLQHLGSDASTRLEPGYNQDEFFDDQFERRSHEIQRTPGADAAVSVVPSKRGPWSGNNQLGIERAFAPDENNRQTILRLDEWDFPHDWTLTLGLEYDHVSYRPTDSFFECTAHIEFGVGGVTQYVEVDWITGVAITLNMNALNVVAQFSSQPQENGLDAALPPDLRLRASLSQGSVRNACPTRSFYVNAISPIIQIPPFAKAVYLLKTGVGDTINFYGNTALINSVRFIGGLGGAQATAVAQRSMFVTYVNVAESIVGAPVAFPIPAGAKFIEIPNLNGEMTIQFLIGL